jgi:hypothetical protein
MLDTALFSSTQTMPKSGRAFLLFLIFSEVEILRTLGVDRVGPVDSLLTDPSVTYWRKIGQVDSRG